ncbi:MAG: sigma-54 dependent transcriptional regulator [Candidatus Sulfotelmatobacter sp.]
MTENTIDSIRLLVVSRDPAVVRLLGPMEDSNAWHLETALSGWEAMERVQSGAASHLLVLDLARGDADSLHFLRWLRRLRPDLPVVLLCHAEDAAIGKEATRLGSVAILVKPFDAKQLESTIRRHIEPAGNIEADIACKNKNIERLGQDAFFVSGSLIMQKLRAQAALLAKTDVPVLILGEAGSGKYTVASLIHQLSVRSGFKLLRVNCAEMPEALLEAELFGDGRVSPARWPSLGTFAAGEKGTIFLEEIAAMPAELQSRLLQVFQNQILQNSESRTPAGNGTMPADVRILAASSANLDRALAEGQLREDLYYLLSAFTVQVPPLRQRKDEIATLLRYFMHKLAKHYSLPARAFSSSMLAACQRYSWPGNLKELETFVKRYLVAGDEELTLGEMALDPAGSTGRSGSRPLPLAASSEQSGSAQKQSKPESLKSLIQGIKSEAERNAIGAALKRTGWNRKAAARLLRVSYRTLLYKIDQYNMHAPEPFLSPMPTVAFSVYDEVKGSGKAS